MYQILLHIGLALMCLWNGIFGAIKPQAVHTVNENGSLFAVDSLGRPATSAGESKKKVGMFYFLWNGEHGTDGPYDISKIVSEHPEAVLSEENWMAAGGGAYGAFHFWGEPLFGYYLTRDKWVLSRHCQMLTDAGVDFLVFDTTNAFIYADRVKDLIDVWYGYMEQGKRVPQLAFYTNSRSGETVNAIYDALYANADLAAKYPKLDSLWFRMNGKPMIVGDQNDPALRGDVRQYFSFRANQWPNEDKKNDGFPWIEFDRLGKLSAFYKPSPFAPSVMSVSVAQHCSTIRFSASAWYGGNDHGRSWHGGAKDTSPGAMLYGHNIAEQWAFARRLDPDIVFVTGFNEWIAQRLQSFENEPISFCDNCNEEYSRDIEPAAGQLADSYYMQLVSEIARFKNSRAALPVSSYVSMQIDGGFGQWDNEQIAACYRDYRGDTAHRDCPGYGDLYYRDQSGRNDIVRAKVAEDAENLWFYVETAAELSPAGEEAWMTLFLNLNGTKPGYDFIVNGKAPENGETAIEQLTENGNTEVGKAQIRYEGNRLMLGVPKAAITPDGGPLPAIAFKWADNYIPGDLLSFYTKGDSAPYGRLNWVYTPAKTQKDPVC